MERRLSRLTAELADLDRAMTEHDPADHVGLMALAERREAVATQVAELEDRWLELADAAG